MAFRRSVGTLLITAWYAWSQTAVITTVAGTTLPGSPPARGFSGDGAAASQALLSLANLQNLCGPDQFEQTTHLFVDPNGNIFFADSENQRIRRISPDGIITTVAGSGERPATNARCEPTGPIGDGAQATAARLYNPSAVVTHPNGAMIIADQQNNRIRQVTPDGVISTIAGSGLHNLYAPGIPAINSPMDWPTSLAIDANGLLYFTEIHGNRVARVGADGRLTTVAGTGFPGNTGDNGPATSAQLKKPTGIAFDSAGNLYVADTGNHRIRKVAVNGTITGIAGTGESGFSGDNGPAVNAMLNTPMDVKVDRQGNVYIADTANHRVRRVDASGRITTLAGIGEAGRGADGVAAPESSLNFPAGLAVDQQDDLYIVDWENYLIRKVCFHTDLSMGIQNIVNSASFSPSVAPGSLITIFAPNLIAETSIAAASPWPRELSGLGVNVNGAPIPLRSVSNGQINAQLPFETPVGNAIATVRSSTGTSLPKEFNIQDAAAGIFQLADSNRGIAINQDGSLNTAENPETSGNVITVLLTGIGLTEPRVASGAAVPPDAPPRAKSPATASVGGVETEVLLIGLQPGTVGIAQAKIRIPNGVPAGPETALVLNVGGNPSNAVIISVR